MIKSSRNLVLISLLLTLFACGETKVKTPSKRPTPPPVPTTDFLITIHTKFGNMKAVLYRQTPIHRENFIKLAKEGFYDGTTFHRIITDFMIQGGDPNSKDEDTNNDGTGGPGYTLKAEISPKLKHNFGTLAAARLGGPSNPEMRSSGSQFYIVESESGTHQLDNQYTVFGQVVEGFDLIHKIVEQEKNSNDRPLDNIEMSIEVEELAIEKLTKQFGKNYNKQ